MLINEMVIFYHVIQSQSFSQAAEKLGVSKSYVSKRINELEADLKTRLLTRSTRHLALTEAGEVFLTYCKTMVEGAREGYNALANLRNQPAGNLKISVPPAMATYLLPPVLIQYTQQCPEVNLEVILENRIVDIIQQGYDLVLRSAVLEDSNLIVQKLLTVNNLLCATPAYLEQHGAVSHPHLLIQHKFAFYSKDKSQQQFKFIQDQQQVNVTIESGFRSNSLELVKQMVLADRAMGVLPEFMITQEIADKKLQICLADYSLTPAPLYAIYPERELMPLNLKIFLQLLKQTLQLGHLS